MVFISHIGLKSFLRLFYPFASLKITLAIRFLYGCIQMIIVIGNAII